ncbi:hypothetical protein L210DRAFT_3759115, partial [Boletus edulis BED1]
MSSQTHPPSLPFPSPPALSTSSFVLEASNSPKSYRALLPRSKSTHLAPTWSTSFLSRTNTPPERLPVALLHHNERDASSVGHAGAGVFWDYAWLLVVASTSTIDPKFRVEKNFASRAPPCPNLAAGFSPRV